MDGVQGPFPEMEFQPSLKIIRGQLIDAVDDAEVCANGFDAGNANAD